MIETSPLASNKQNELTLRGYLLPNFMLKCLRAPYKPSIKDDLIRNDPIYRIKYNERYGRIQWVLGGECDLSHRPRTIFGSDSCPIECYNQFRENSAVNIQPR